LADVLEGVAIEEPRYFMAASMYPPLKAYWHLDVPAGVSLGCNADRAHRTGITGKDIKVAMVDSGWFKHPYFVNRGYRAAPVVLGRQPLIRSLMRAVTERENQRTSSPWRQTWSCSR
jgi:hypothetical protein